MTASAVALDRPAHFALIAAGAGPDPGTMLLGAPGGVARVVVSTGKTDGSALTVPDQGLVEGFSPDGRQVIYLDGHGPVALWVGDIGSTTVSKARELLPDVGLASLSW